MNSNDFYPLNRKQLAERLGYSGWGMLGVRNAIEHIPNDRVTYIGREQRFTADVVDILTDKGFAKKHKVESAHRTIMTPMGEINLENGVEIPKPYEKPTWVSALDKMVVKQSFSVEAKTGKVLQNAVTDANNELAPKVFSRRYYPELNIVRIWRMK